MSLACSNLNNSYGILRYNCIPGALLYGLLRTGKTQLVRVLAKELSAIMLQASSANIQSKWGDEIEKFIKALFLVGKILWPYIIFIDEADSLFRTRNNSREGWARDRVNQLLIEADGLSRSSQSPFLLLVTNFPLELDNAVLRRISSRFYLGFPPYEARKNLFDIFLEGENLGSDVNLETLATATQRYTNSNIKTLCIEAVLACKRELNGKSAKRELRFSHFETAFKSSSPTVSDGVMNQIKRFAEKFDYCAVSQIAEEIKTLPSHSLQVDRLAVATRRSTNGSAEMGSRPVERVERDDSNTQGFDEPHEATVGTIPSHKVVPTGSTASLPTKVRRPFPYEALSEANSEIRLLEFVDTKMNESRVECLIHKVSLHEEVNFTALSYVWGGSCKSGEILLDQVPMPVTPNLENSLRWAKYHWKKKFPDRDVSRLRLWADGVCINQDDIKERNHQIQLMKDLHSKAELVISAVAHNHSRVPRAFQVYHDVYDILINSEPRFSFDDICSYEWMKRLPYLCREDAGAQALLHNLSWNAVVEFLSLPYWKRVWIVQEVTLAQSVLLVCDEACLELEKMLETSAILMIPIQVSQRRFSHSKPEFVSRRAWCYACVEMLRDVGVRCMAFQCEMALKNSNLGRLMLQHFHASRIFTLEATDPRDYIYGLLGLLEIDIKPDYNKTVDQVYLDFATTILRGSASFEGKGACERCFRGCDFLSRSGIAKRRSDLSIPSWVPDFSDAESGSDRRPALFTKDTPKCNCPHARSDVAKGKQPIIKGRILCVPGVHVETITKFTAIHKGCKEDTMRNLSKLNPGIVDLIREYSMKFSQYVTGIPVLQAIYRILILNPGSWDSASLTRGLRVLVDLLCGWKYGFDSDAIIRSLDLGFRRSFDPNDSEDAINWILKNVFPGEENMFDRSGYDALMSDGWTASTQRCNQNLFQTQNGYLGCADSGIASGHMICVLQDCGHPVILRRKDDFHVHVGTCFVLGLTNENVSELLTSGEKSLETFEVH